MKKFALLVFALAALSGVQAAAAQDGRPPGPPTFAELDADGDGVVTEEEFLAPMLERASEHFDGIDTDADGVITETELEAAPFGPHRRPNAQ